MAACQDCVRTSGTHPGPLRVRRPVVTYDSNESSVILTEIPEEGKDTNEELGSASSRGAGR